MATAKRSGLAPEGDEARPVDQLAGRIDGEPTNLRRGVQAISSPREAVEAMIAAGAVFSVRKRDDALGVSFSYQVSPGGDAERARAILAMVKGKPPVYLQAFKAHVQSATGRIA